MQTLTTQQVDIVSGGTSAALEVGEAYAGAVLTTGAGIVAGVAGAPIIAGAIVVGAVGLGLAGIFIGINHLLS